jgi:hypothetical protein
LSPKRRALFRVYFISDASGVFDEIAFPSTIEVRDALHHNGSRRFADNSDLQSLSSSAFCAVSSVLSSQGPDLFLWPFLASLMGVRSGRV